LILRSSDWRAYNIEFLAAELERLPLSGLILHLTNGLKDKSELKHLRQILHVDG